MTLDLQDLRFVRAADVYKAGILAGTLRRTDDGLVDFSYLAEYTDRQVATTLPIDGPPISTAGGGVPAFFAGLLPEGHRLTVLKNATKTSPSDELTLLMAVGADVPGDVQVVPSGVAPTEPKPLADSPDGEVLDFRHLAEVVDLHGIPGVQDKLSASMLSAPLTLGTGRYILKLDPADHPHLVVNEALHLHHARSIKLPVAEGRTVTDHRGETGLLVTRFDRRKIDGRWIRLPLEDATQVLGLPPASKYTVASEDAVAGLARQCSAPVLAIRNLYLQFVFAWLTGNGDLHAKNISVLGQLDGTTSVAPMYDIPCTVLYRDNSLALPVAGRTTKIKARHWAEFAACIGLPARAARSANASALRVARSVDLGTLPFGGSVLRGARRELDFRRSELEE
ncbi:type II toxin-antitoxin system HipA family toxin [Actinomycetes bacterium M1A6_2h]